MLSILKLIYRRLNLIFHYGSNNKIYGLIDLEEKILSIINKLYKNEIYVLNGPFSGMKYISESNGSQLLPKLIGCYEEPIHNWILEIINNPIYKTIIDVGCAEGYYAVGFAKSPHHPQIIAFDIDNTALENAKKLAVLNNVVESIKFFNQFEYKFLENLLKSKPNQKVLVFMDIEGDERILLDTKKFPVIKECDFLVELHDCFYPGLTEKIISFFNQTHKIQIILDYPWREKEYCFNYNDFSSDETHFLFNENRPTGMSWMYAKRK
ncbi:methyltransferase [Aquirufa sp. 2-AUSEE-184A6]|uniref:Methyltransferase n=1 Tax=Aquirufa novilacunae TaxID=3139305 RepID=A0ABW8SYK5_9BACT